MSWFSNHLQRLGEKEQHILVFPPAQVDESYDQHPMREHQDYLKIEVAEAYLQVETMRPVIYAHIGFSREGSWVSWPNLVFPNAAQPEPAACWPNNAPLVPTLPYGGEEVILSVGMFVLHGDSGKEAHLNTLRTVAGTLQTPKVARMPELSASLDDGLRSLLTCSDAQLTLGLHTIFGGFHQERYPWIHQGYLALIGTHGKELDQTLFRVCSGKLCLWDPQTETTTPYRDNNFLLLRLCLFQDRNDLSELAGIHKFYDQSRHALLHDNEDMALYFIKRAIQATYDCEDLTRAEKFRTIDGLKRDFKDVRDALETTGFFSDAKHQSIVRPSHNDGVLTPPRPDDSADRKPEVYLPSLDDIFEDLLL